MQTSFKNVRIKVVKDYYLIYEYNESEIAVLAIWDTNQNPDNQKNKTLITPSQNPSWLFQGFLFA